MKRLVLKKWVEVMFSVVALFGIVMCWGFGNKDLILSLIGAGVGMGALSVIIIYGNN